MSIKTTTTEAHTYMNAKALEHEVDPSQFASNAMTVDNPAWVGHGFGAPRPTVEDLLSSPEWTDPSPALTDSLTFDVDSCNPSPLFETSHDGDFGTMPDMAGAPLFSPNDGYASTNVSPYEAMENSFDLAASSSKADFSDFPLFPSAHDKVSTVAAAPASPGRQAQMAFSRSEPTLATTQAYQLLRDLSREALPLTASPLLLSSPPASASAAHTPKATDEEPVEDKDTAGGRPTVSRRGTKRRLDPADLLALDAPIQPRTYKRPSATSRKDSRPSVSKSTSAESLCGSRAPSTAAGGVDEDEDERADREAVARVSDPIMAKRLSNTLAARRSRHRKAAELNELHSTINELRRDVEMWKRRCERAERERDAALA